jgi:hypothetical protein
MRSFLYKTLRKGSEVRRLIIHSLDGSHSTELIHLTSDVRSPIAHGTEYEMRQRADALAQNWIGQEGFEHLSSDEPVYEPLSNTVALATEIGHSFLYDPRYKDVKILNLTGAVPLKKWVGVKGRSGKPYEYAFTGLQIIARPALPHDHGLNLKPANTEELLSVLRNAVALRAAIGRDESFVLGDSE